MQKDFHKYEDMADLPHHVSSVHPQMDTKDRAAQFAPFSALTGQEAAIKETARLTQERKELDEEYQQILDERLQQLREQLHRKPFILITFFVTDEKKAGGTYVTVKDRVKKWKEYEQELVMENGTLIPLRDITELEGELFEEYE